MDFNTLTEPGMYSTSDYKPIVNSIFLDPNNEKMLKWFRRWHRFVKVEAHAALYDQNKKYVGEIIKVHGLFSKIFIRKARKFIYDEEVVTKVF